jgi:hypothetical protein
LLCDESISTYEATALTSQGLNHKRQLFGVLLVVRTALVMSGAGASHIRKSGGG